MRTRWLLLIVVLIAAGCWGDDKDTPESRYPDDTRLDQKVSIAILGRPLYVICDELSKATGVAIRTEGPAKERKLTLIYTDTPLRAILFDIHTITYYAWSKDWMADPSPSPQYLIWRDSRAKAIEDAAAEEPARKAKERQVEDYRWTLDSYAKALALDPTSPDFGKLKETNPWAYVQLQDPHSRAGIEFVFSLGQDKLSSFVDSGHLTMKLTDLSVGQKEKLLYGINHDEQTDEEGENWFDKWANGEDSVVSLGADEVISIGYGPPKQGIYKHIMYQKGMYTTLAIDQLNKDGKLTPDEYKRLKEIALAAVKVRMKRPHDAEVEDRIAADPDLEKLIKIQFEEKGPRRQTLDVVAAVAKASGLNLCAHFFTDPEMSLAPKTERKLDYYLEAIYNHAKLDWAKRDGTLYLTHEFYYIMLDQEIPERVIAQWAAYAEQRPRFELDDLAALAQALPERQLWSAPYVPKLKTAIGTPLGREQRKALLFYGSLTKAQKDEAAREGGLAIADLTQEQQRLFELAAYAAAGEAVAAAAAELAPSIKWDEARFAITPGEIENSLLLRFDIRAGKSDTTWINLAPLPKPKETMPK